MSLKRVSRSLTHSLGWFFRPLVFFLGKVSIRVRLTFLFVFIFGSTSFFFSYVLYDQSLQSLRQDFDDALFNYAVDVTDSIQIGAKGDLQFPPLTVDNEKILPFPLGTALIQVAHISGTVLARKGEWGEFNAPVLSEFEKIALGEEASYTTLDDITTIPEAEASTYRMVSFPLDNAERPQLILQVAAPLTLLENQVAQRLHLIRIGIPLVLIIATLAGLFFASRALSPIESMVNSSQEIGAEDLSRRLPVPATKDEIRRLAITMNEMLSRIEKSFRSQERFIADASHQLLTPLTILKGEIEMAKKNPPADLDSFLDGTLQEVDYLARIVKDMLLLARIDAGSESLALKSLYLDDILMECIARLQKLANKKNVQIQFNIIASNPSENRHPIEGDEDFLSCLFENLIENAIKYTAENSTVRILLVWHKEISHVAIEDEGPGIDASTFPVLFDRFSRSRSLSPKVKGYGLGLAIAQKIAKLHGAIIRAENLKPLGARFSIEIKNQT